MKTLIEIFKDMYPYIKKSFDNCIYSLKKHQAIILHLLSIVMFFLFLCLAIIHQNQIYIWLMGASFGLLFREVIKRILVNIPSAIATVFRNFSALVKFAFNALISLIIIVSSMTISTIYVDEHSIILKEFFGLEISDLILVFISILLGLFIQTLFSFIANYIYLKYFNDIKVSVLLEFFFDFLTKVLFVGIIGLQEQIVQLAIELKEFLDMQQSFFHEDFINILIYWFFISTLCYQEVYKVTIKLIQKAKSGDKS